MVGSSNIPASGKLCMLLPALIAILLVPIAFGGVTPATQLFCDCLLLASFVLWVVGNVFEKRIPRLSVWILGSLAVFASLAVSQLINARAFLDRETWTLVENQWGSSLFPGTLDRMISLVSIRHGLALGLSLLVFLDLASDRTIRWAMLRVIAMSGFLVAITGISQKAGNSPAMLWSTPEQSGNWFFGAFHYHANAGAFLNLCWPAALALWLKHCHQPGSGFQRSLWLSVAFITFLAVFVNTSKGAQLIAFFLFAVVLVRFQKMIFWKGRNWKAAGASAMAIVVAAFILVLPGMMTFQERWANAFDHEGSFFARLSLYVETLALLPQSGFWGAGAGTFRLLLPDFANVREAPFPGLYLHAHQDYLQFLVEWGIPGLLAFLLPVAIGLKKGVQRVRSITARDGIEFSTSFSLIAMLGVLCHAGIDFPLQVPAIQLVAIAYFSILWTGNFTKRSHHLPARKHFESSEDFEGGGDSPKEESWEEEALEWELPESHSSSSENPK